MNLDCSAERLSSISTPDLLAEISSVLNDAIKLGGGLDSLKQTLADQGIPENFLNCGTLQGKICSGEMERFLGGVSSSYATWINNAFDNPDLQLPPWVNREDLRQQLLGKQVCLNELISRLNNSQLLIVPSCNEATSDLSFSIEEDCSQREGEGWCEQISLSPLDAQCKNHVCGNGVVEDRENCEPSQKGGGVLKPINTPCTDYGFSDGIVSCNPQTCRWDFSNCSGTLQYDRTEQTPGPTSCLSEDGEAGKTGSGVVPNINYSYGQWEYSNCVLESKSACDSGPSRTEQMAGYCDATGFFQFLLGEIHQIQNPFTTDGCDSLNTGSFTIALMADGFGSPEEMVDKRKQRSDIRKRTYKRNRRLS